MTRQRGDLLLLIRSDQNQRLHLLSRWGGGGKLGCYKKREKAAAVDTNKNDGVEMSITGDVDRMLTH